jgi:hypothetical protein
MHQSNLTHAVDHSDDGNENELESQEAMTRITFFMSWYCTTRMTAKWKHKIGTPNNNYFLSDCWSNHIDCEGTKVTVIMNVHNRHCGECDGQKFYIILQGAATTNDG